MAKIFSQTLIIVLLILIFYVTQSSAQLMCWSCTSCPDPFTNTSSLVSASVCNSAQTVCVKNTVRVLNRKADISKGCVQSCTPSSSNFFGQGAFVDCCNTNFCNFSTRNQSSLSISLLCLAIFSLIVYYNQ